MTRWVLPLGRSITWLVSRASDTNGCKAKIDKNLKMNKWRRASLSFGGTTRNITP